MAELPSGCPGFGLGAPTSPVPTTGSLPGVDVGPPPGMVPTPPAIVLCLFELPDITKLFFKYALPPIDLGFTLPPILLNFPPINIDCFCDNPLNATGSLPSGGGHFNFLLLY